MVLDDVGKLLVVGRPSILRSVAEMTKIFAKSDNHDILNALYMTDMKAWFENLNEQAIARVAHEFRGLWEVRCQPGSRDRVDSRCRSSRLQ